MKEIKAIKRNLKKIITRKKSYSNAKETDICLLLLYAEISAKFSVRFILER